MFVEPSEIFEPIRKFQVRVAETPQQIDALIDELVSSRQSERRKPAEPPPYPCYEMFNAPKYWERLVKVGQWKSDPTSGLILGDGMYRYLWSDYEYGTRAFMIDASIEFLDLNPESAIDAVNAGIVLDWDAAREKPRYLHLMFTGTRLLLEQIGYSGGDEYYDFRHIDEGERFLLQVGRPYLISVVADEESIDVSVDGRRVYSVRPPGGSIIGKAGLRPWRSLLRCERFEVSM